MHTDAVMTSEARGFFFRKTRRLKIYIYIYIYLPFRSANLTRNICRCVLRNLLLTFASVYGNGNNLCQSNEQVFVIVLEIL